MLSCFPAQKDEHNNYFQISDCGGGGSGSSRSSSSIVVLVLV